MKIYSFGLDESVDNVSEILGPNELGGKGAGLIWMTKQGLPVPPGLIIPTEVWAQYDSAPKSTMKEVAKAIAPYMAKLKEHFGYMPLVSVRSGSRVSCPGMMDTILNVGIDPDDMQYWESKLGAECAHNSLHRLVTMLASVVVGFEREEFETSGNALELYKEKAGTKFPGPAEQLLGSIDAVFKSWDNERAKIYRKMNKIPHEWGTACIVQAMVFGNLNDKSGTGVLFTRNPDTGENKVTGEFLINAQGEDVVAGIRTPVNLDKMVEWDSWAANQLISNVCNLEKLKKDVQDVEFTIQDGKLYILQTRNAKRSARAAIRIAIEMYEEGVLTKEEMVSRVSPKQYDLAQQDVIDPAFKVEANFKGLPACSGVVSGKPVFSSKDAIKCKVPCILITKETTPDDIGGMQAAVGVITMTGGATSHAAVVARSMNKPCIVGLGQVAGNFVDQEVVSMDGATGRIWLGPVKVISGKNNVFCKEFADYALQVAEALPVITDTPKKAMDTAVLVLNNIFDTKSSVKSILGAAPMVGVLYVDLSIPDEKASQAFHSIFKEFCGPQKIVDSCSHLTFDTKVIFIGDVTSKKYEVVNGSMDIRSLILADKEMALSGTITDPAILKVIEWKKKEGITFISFGGLIKGVKSFASLEQALHLNKV